MIGLVSLPGLRSVLYPTHATVMGECEMIALEGVSHVVQRVGPARRPARLAAKLETTSSLVSGSHIAILCMDQRDTWRCVEQRGGLALLVWRA